MLKFSILKLLGKKLLLKYCLKYILFRKKTCEMLHDHSWNDVVRPVNSFFYVLARSKEYLALNTG